MTLVSKIAKVMNSADGKGQQRIPHEIINIGCGRSISIRDLVTMVIQKSNRNLTIEFDRSKPSIPSKLALNIDRAKEFYGWSPQISLEDGIDECQTPAILKITL